VCQALYWTLRTTEQNRYKFPPSEADIWGKQQQTRDKQMVSGSAKCYRAKNEESERQWRLWEEASFDERP
jgi:hypothetical protein